MSPAVQKNDYLQILLTKNKKQKAFYVHRLVMENFIRKEDGKQVNHINGNKHDNRLENLEWVTAKDNTIKAYETGLRKKGKHLYNTRWIYQFDLQMKFLKKWESMTQASKELSINQSEISKCCAGKINKYGKWIWLDDTGLLNYIDNSIPKEKHEKLKEHCKTLIKEKQELSTVLLESISKEVIEKKIEEINEDLTENESYTTHWEITRNKYFEQQGKKAGFKELLEGK